METETWRVRVGSARNGRGVFAARAFAAAEIVGGIAGRLIERPGYDSEYCIDLGRGRLLEPDPPFRYLNHACAPNCHLFGRNADGWAERLFVRAVRRIAPGEELTIDYGWAADAAIRCQCGDPGCRGWIVAEEELHLLASESESVAR